MSFFLGVDVGSSKTHALIADEPVSALALAVQALEPPGSRLQWPCTSDTGVLGQACHAAGSI